MTHTFSDIIDLTNAPTPPRWFEFVFEPERLEKHLDTSPVELITSFFRNMPDLEAIDAPNTNGTTNGVSNESEPNESDGVYEGLPDVWIPAESFEANYRTKKSYALQTLAIKVASYLKWDLDTLCEGLTIPIQHKLLKALKSACQHEKCPDEVKKFASVIYCRWFLRSAIAYKLSTLQPQSSSTTIIYLSQLQQQQQSADTYAFMSMGCLFSVDSKELKSCSVELYNYVWDLTHNKGNSPKKLKTTNHPFKKAKLSRPNAKCFNPRDEDLNDWNECESIEPLEFIEAACYDLGRFLFFVESYNQSADILDIIKASKDRYPLLECFLKSAREIVNTTPEGQIEESNERIESQEDKNPASPDHPDIYDKSSNDERKQTERYLFDLMAQFSKGQNDHQKIIPDEPIDDLEEDSDLRLDLQSNSQQKLPENCVWYLQNSTEVQQQQLLEMGKGDLFMSRGNFKQALGCFVGALMLMTDYFRVFSKNYIEEEPYITRMIQCSISLSCFTQAVALCQMTRNLNYTMAFKQLNERVCNDCCDDIYECIWNITLLEYIINIHARRGEIERRTKVIQLLGQLELNENNPEEIIREAEHLRRGRFFRIMSNKYL